MSDKGTHLHWTDAEGRPARALWRSEAGIAPYQTVALVDDATPANTAYKLACEGTGLLWVGDFHNGKQLLQALTRRLDKLEQAGKSKGKKGEQSLARADAGEAFHQHRQRQAHRARILGMLLLPFEADHHIPLRRAPDARVACEEAYGPGGEPYVASMRELLGLIGAHEWRKKGVEIPALKGRIHAHYGVFSPLRGEYIDLVAQAPIPSGAQLAFDIGTGSGVLAAVLARRGIAQVIATDQDPRALACAAENVARLGLQDRVQVIQTDLFPPGQAPLIVCNPPWLPARPSSPIEYAIYDPDSRMLRGFLDQLATHLAPDGEGWLIMSDLAEHLGLRAKGELHTWIAQAGLQVAGRLDARPRHAKAQDARDPLHLARAAEVTSLWRLKRA
jgi:methylase of polypeptide subunit release factors